MKWKMEKLILFLIILLLVIPLIYAENYGAGTYGSGTYSTGETPAEAPSIGVSGGKAVTSECSQDSDCGENRYCFKNKCYDAQCFDDSVCNIEKGERCWNYRCVKLFDIEILEFESPAKLGEFFDFKYFIKGVANISGDVKIEFWIEQNGNIVTSGSDVIYMGSFEEKTKTKKLFLPSDVTSGTYQFFIQLTFGEYTIEAHRTVEITVSEEGIVIIKLTPEIREQVMMYIIIALIALIIIIFLIFYLKRRKSKEKRKHSTRKKLLLILISVGLIICTLILKLNIKITGHVINSINKKQLIILIPIITIGILTFVVIIYRKKIKELAKKVFSKTMKHQRNSLKGLIGKKVYTENAEFIGRVKDIILGEKRIEKLKIKSDKGEGFKPKKIIIKYKHVKDVGHVVIINSAILEQLMNC